MYAQGCGMRRQTGYVFLDVALVKLYVRSAFRGFVTIKVECCLCCFLKYSD